MLTVGFLFQNYDTSESKLRREFEVYGAIKKIVLCHNAINGKPRGYAFIEYEHERDMHCKSLINKIFLRNLPTALALLSFIRVGWFDQNMARDIPSVMHNCFPNVVNQPIGVEETVEALLRVAPNEVN